jgi:hypothetical protein
MVGIKDLLEGWKSNNGGSERVSSGMSVLEMNRERKKITVVGRAWRYKYPQSLTVVYGRHCCPYRAALPS